jgi:hypothetical protein
MHKGVPKFDFTWLDSESPIRSHSNEAFKYKLSIELDPNSEALKLVDLAKSENSPWALFAKDRIPFSEAGFYDCFRGAHATENAEYQDR